MYEWMVKDSRGTQPVTSHKRVRVHDERSRELSRALPCVLDLLLASVQSVGSRSSLVSAAAGYRIRQAVINSNEFREV